MKKHILVVFLIVFLTSAVIGQINNPNFQTIDIYDLFKNTTWADSIKTGTPVGNHRLVYLACDSAALSVLTDSVMTSNPINTTSGNIQIVIKVDSVNYGFGTMNALIEYGTFRGPNFSADGYEWHTLLTCTQDTVFEVNITTQTWNQNEEYQHFKYRITKTGQQANRYYIFHNMWRRSQ